MHYLPQRGRRRSEAEAASKRKGDEWHFRMLRRLLPNAHTEHISPIPASSSSLVFPNAVLWQQPQPPQIEAATEVICYLKLELLWCLNRCAQPRNRKAGQHFLSHFPFYYHITEAPFSCKFFLNLSIFHRDFKDFFPLNQNSHSQSKQVFGLSLFKAYNWIFLFKVLPMPMATDRLYLIWADRRVTTGYHSGWKLSHFAKGTREPWITNYEVLAAVRGRPLVTLFQRFCPTVST